MKETTKKNGLELQWEVLKDAGLAAGQEIGALSLDGVVLLTRDGRALLPRQTQLDLTVG